MDSAKDQEPNGNGDPEKLSKDMSSRTVSDGLLNCFTKPKKTCEGPPGNCAAVDLSPPDKYSMRHPKRGKAVIFNHINFTCGQSTRHGSEVDEGNLAVCLSSLGFEVKVHRDLKRDKFLQVLETLKNEDHSNQDCIMIIVLSHGEQGIIYCKDNCYRVEDLWTPFMDDACPSLAGKPKIFLIQACRGDQVDSGTLLKRGRTQIDSKSYDDPNENNSFGLDSPDFLVVFSTVPGYYSWRNTDQGSWLMQAVVKTLNAYKNKKDFLSMMTIVAREVALNFQSSNPNDKKFDGKKQAPMICSTLTRDIFF